jgi:DNA primase
MAVSNKTPIKASFRNARTLKACVDLVAFASKFTRLRRSGRQFLGLCPFHSERHSSFYVDPEKQVFYCFGCSEGGDLFDFVMRAEGCGFRRALKVVSLGVAAESMPRSGMRFRGGVGAKPLKAAKRPGSHSPPDEAERARILARLNEAETRAAAIRRSNLIHAFELATACEPLAERELLYLSPTG